MATDVGGVKIPRSLAELPVTQPRWVGQPMKRVEDPLLVTGRAQMIDDVDMPGMLHCAILHSPYAHARIKSIDVSEAEKLPGVAAVMTAEGAQRWSNPGAYSSYILAADKVCYVGQPVAAVAATSRYVAEDALERIKVEYEPLPVLMDATKALEPDAPLIFEPKGTNLVWQRKFTWGDVDKALREADHVFTEKFRWNRMSGNPIETFGIISQWDPLEDSLTQWGTFQAPMLFHSMSAMMFGLPPHKVRLIGLWHGAAYGAKHAASELVLPPLLSRMTGGRPVKYIQDRMEYLVSGPPAWDRHFEASLAVKKDGTVTALRVKLLENGGGILMGGAATIALLKPLAIFTGCYTIPVADYEVTLVATNKSPMGGLRGMGPPCQYIVLEGLMDIAARALRMDPAELRRKNFIPPDRFPYTIPSGNEYDSGNYEAALDAILKLADYPRLRREQEEARKQGRYLGIGLVSTIEPGAPSWNLVGMGGFMPGMTTFPEGARVSIDPFGKITAKLGFPHQGQGQYTFVTQILADYFAVDPSDIRVVNADTSSAPMAFGPGGSRQAVTLSAAVLGAAVLLKEKLAKVAAKLMEVRPDDVELMDGMFRVKGVPGAEMPLTQVLGVMTTRSDLLPPDVDPNPEVTYVYTTPDRTMPDEEGRCKSYLTAASAIHMPVVEVDPETGQVKILKYYIADDCGTRLNPASVEGQIQGSMAMGLGIALLEELVYDEQGQPLATTFMDYPMPTINEVPMTEKIALCTPSPVTALGAKGTGEGAIHTTPAALVSAINDALAPLGVRVTETPATPNRLWKLIQEAKRQS